MKEGTFFVGFAKCTTSQGQYCLSLCPCRDEGYKTILFLNGMDEPCLCVNGKTAISRHKRKLNTRRRLKIFQPSGRDLAMVEERAFTGG